jgi:hypothetical protein
MVNVSSRRPRNLVMPGPHTSVTVPGLANCPSVQVRVVWQDGTEEIGEGLALAWTWNTVQVRWRPLSDRWRPPDERTPQYETWFAAGDVERQPIES